MAVCPACGSESPSDAGYCQRCGRPLEEHQPPKPSEPGRPVLTYHPKLSGLYVIVGVFTLFIPIGFLIYPIPVSSILFCGGVVALGLYALLVSRKSAPRSVVFYDDRIVIPGPPSETMRYGEVISMHAVRFLQSYADLTIKDRGSRLRIAGNLKTDSGADFYTWLEAKVSAAGGTLVTRLGPVVAASFAAVGAYVVGVALIAVAFRSIPDIALNVAEGVAVVPAVATFLAVFRRSTRAREPSAQSIDTDRRSASFWRQQARSFFGARRWLPLAILSVMVLGLFAFVALPFLPGEQAYFLQSWNQTTASLRSLPSVGVFLALFGNNLKIAALEMIPGVGPFLGIGVTYNTARSAEVAYPTHPLAFMTQLFLLPHTWLEVSGYAIAVYSSFRFLRGAVSQGLQLEEPPVRSVDRFVVAFASVASLLAVAALLETVEPMMSDPYLLWIPVAIAGLLVVWVMRKHS